MDRLVSTVGAVIITAVVTALVVVLTAAGGRVGAAEAAEESATGPSLAAVVREQRRINKRLRAALLRANRANKSAASIRRSLAALPTAQGSQGAQGPAGPPGPQGPAGATGPPGLAGVEVVSRGAIPIPAGTAAFNEATCPAGKTPISGGVYQSNAAGSSVFTTSGNNLSVVGTQLLPAQNRVVASVDNQTVFSKFFSVYAVCATVVP